MVRADIYAGLREVRGIGRNCIKDTAFCMEKQAPGWNRKKKEASIN